MSQFDSNIHIELDTYQKIKYLTMQVVSPSCFSNNLFLWVFPVKNMTFQQFPRIFAQCCGFGRKGTSTQLTNLTNSEFVVIQEEDIYRKIHTWLLWNTLNEIYQVPRSTHTQLSQKVRC